MLTLLQVGNTGLDMSPFIKNVSFCSVNILGILRNSVPIAARIFREAMGLLRSGAVKPVDPISVMPIGRIEEAFRLMQSGKHMGKIVLTTHDDDIVPVISRGLKSIEFDPSCTYLLSGGLGGLGRSISEWMLEHGARHLVFLSRSGSAKPEAQKTLAKLSKAGAHAAAYSCDITDATQVKAALAKAREHFPPIRGAIQGAMALHVREASSPTIKELVLTILGCYIPEYDTHTVGELPQAKSTRQLESARTATPRHGFLPLSLVRRRSRRLHRPRQLLSR